MAKPTPATDGESEKQISADAMREGDLEVAAFATQAGIAEQTAHTVMSRATAEYLAGKFECPGH